MAERLSDEALAADQRAYEAQEARLRALNERGHRLGDAPMAKARCWIDASRHEHDRNDPSAFPREALAQAERWLDALERGTPAPDDTAALPAATRLRPDLWQRLRTLRAEDGTACRPRAAAVACAEVALLHAGHEHDQQGWRHAAPYLAAAEELVDRAGAASRRCEADR